jgi:putative hydrolase of the HAD superfamily
MRHQRLEPAPKLVLFDLDDTLCDYAAARQLRLEIALSHAFDGAGTPLPHSLDAIIAESIERHPHGVDHFPQLLAEHGVDHPEAIAAAQAWYRENRFHGLALFPDAIETLQVVRTCLSGRRIGIITNGPAEVQTAKLELFALRPYVDFILISGVFGSAKPEIAIFAEALRLGKATPDEAVYIGDSPEYDIVGARNSGIRSIWVNRTGSGWSRADPAPDHEATDLEDVRRLLGCAH